MEATKQDVLKLIEGMPDEVSLEDIIYTLYVRAIIEAGLDDARHGRTVSHADVMKDAKEWLRSTGR